MSMIEVSTFIDGLKDKPLKRLYRERDLLLRQLRRYENDKLTEDEIYCCPSPDTVYTMTTGYLHALIDLIEEKVLAEKKYPTC